MERKDPNSEDWYFQNPIWESHTFFFQARAAAIALRAQFKKANVTLNSSSDLARLIERALRFAESPERETGNERLLLRAMVEGQFLDRIARACATVEGMVDERQHIARMKKGSVDPGSRQPSQAKDKLFELELFALLREQGLAAALAEPDITVKLTYGNAGVACKRIYSLSNAKSQISRAVRQLADVAGPKILALCLDDLLPEYAILDATTPRNASEMLASFGTEFFKRFDQQLFAYMSSGRVSFAVSSTTAPFTHGFENDLIAAQTQLVFWMPTPALGEISVQARRVCDAMFFQDSERWSPT